jgi:hypothetical protein
MQRLYSCTAVIIQLYCSGYTAVLQWLYSCTAVVIQLYCSGYTAVLQWLYSCTAVVIQLYSAKASSNFQIECKMRSSPYDRVTEHLVTFSSFCTPVGSEW